MRLLSYFTPKTPYLLVYMLQQFEYSSSKFLSWIFTFPNLSKVQKRGKLEFTARAKLMLTICYIVWLISVLYVVYLAINLSIEALALFLFIPDIIIGSLFISSFLLQYIAVKPSQNNEISKAVQKLNLLNAVRIAVIGSYGKTTMKELLYTVISEGKKVAVTPGNKNVLISHARWLNSDIAGDEDVLVFEYGESEPGDIGKLASFSKPKIAVITGIAPAHMDGYPTLNAIEEDFASIKTFISYENTYLNNQKLLTDNIQGTAYDSDGFGEWKVSKTSITIDGTDFTLSNGKESLELHSGLLGLHNIGPITVVVSIAKNLGLSNEQIISGVAKTEPFEHRMQPRPLNGAWIIDDTYNGNIEGMRAGLELLKTLPAKRKIYVTPGLVDQGTENESVHKELGRLISMAKPDKVVLIQNSVTEIIKQSLVASNYAGELVVEINPLEYYTNLEHYLAGGDLILLQNDWPDSYK